ncbi:MAG: hypothetical protein DWP97_03265 [Calditrichaeota bacterium]|nr:MAG: hypothetical protein DWP97_03265 [Calditrichota bacterium]
MKKIILLLSFTILLGCDGYYFIYPFDTEIPKNSNVDKGRKYIDSTSCLSLTIEGGSMQTPFGGVQAPQLYVWNTISSIDSFNISVQKAEIVTDSGILYPQYVSIDYFSEKKKFETIFHHNYDSSSYKDEINLQMASGIFKITLFFPSYYIGKGLIQFPISYNMGYLSCQNDTIFIEDLKFNASR